MCHYSTEFCENRTSSFCVILLTNKQTNADENTISLAEAMIPKCTTMNVDATGKLEAGVDESGVEHADGDVLELVTLSGHQRRLERDLGKRPVAAVKYRVSEVVHVRRAGRLRPAPRSRRTPAVAPAYPVQHSSTDLITSG